jgi:hypothetical protein
MNKTLDYILAKYQLAPCDVLPVILKQESDRKGLIKLFADLRFNKGVEVGVASGDHALAMCQTVPNLELTCIDHWRGERKKHRIETQKKLAGYNVKLITDLSENVVEQIEPGSLDFVYIDAGHTFDAIMLDLIKWSKKVRTGGIVSGHDYGPINDRLTRNRTCGVYEAVNAYVDAHYIKNLFVIDSESVTPTFFWVN